VRHRSSVAGARWATVRDREWKKKAWVSALGDGEGVFCRARRHARFIEAEARKAWCHRVGVHVAVELCDALGTDAHSWRRVNRLSLS
jgi:hypothetical protein